jgi:hypothetical protein
MEDPNFAAAEAQWLIEPICGRCGYYNPCLDGRCELDEAG